MAGEEDHRTVMEQIRPPVGGYGSNIVHPAVEANTSELKPAIDHTAPSKIGGSPSDDPYAHLEKFLSICDTFKFNGVTTDAVRLKLFPFSLQGEASEWHACRTTGWFYHHIDGLAEAFLRKQFLQIKMAQVLCDITSFKQKDGETLISSWTKFKKVLTLRMCPQHGLSSCQQIQTFYNGVQPSVQFMLDAATDDSLFRKTPIATLEVISNIVESNMGWPYIKKEEGRSP